MATLPFLPPGVNGLPAHRSVLLADGSNVIQRIDEKVAGSFVSYWISPTLNRFDSNTKGNLRLVSIRYSSSNAGTVDISASPDGGGTWVTKTVVVSETGNSTKRASIAFNVSGYDVRIKVAFPASPLVKLISYKIDMIPTDGIGHE